MSKVKERRLTTGHAAAELGVDAVLLRRLADEGVVASTRTPGGHRRFALSEIEPTVRRYSQAYAEWMAARPLATKEVAR